MLQLGLKVWSVNPEAQRQAAIALAEAGLYNYIEIYVVPGTLSALPRWQEVPVPKIIHTPHLAHHFNFADASLADSNRAAFTEVERYADELNAPWIVCHGGTGGTPEEAVRQIASFADSRCILENKPFWQHPNYMPEGDRHCRGAVWEEFAAMQKALGCHTCHDLAHTICMANSLKLNAWEEIPRFEAFQPVLHHLSDLTTANDELDSHTGIGQGAVDWVRALRAIPPDAMVTLETPKPSPDDLDAFSKEVRMIREKGF